MGNECYRAEAPQTEGAHLYVHSRKDGKDGYCYLLVNNSLTEDTTISVDSDAELYILSGNGNMRSKVMYLNGKPLSLGEGNALPCLDGEKVAAGEYKIPAGACAFVVV